MLSQNIFIRIVSLDAVKNVFLRNLFITLKTAIPVDYKKRTRALKLHHQIVDPA